jgi:hypothetical protein
MDGRDEKCVQSFGRKSQRERPIGRPKLRGKYNIKIKLREVWWEDVQCIHVA